MESKDTASPCDLEKNAEVDWKILEEILSDTMFHVYSVMKNKSPTSSLDEMEYRRQKEESMK